MSTAGHSLSRVAQLTLLLVSLQCVGVLAQQTPTSCVGQSSADTKKLPASGIPAAGFRSGIASLIRTDAASAAAVALSVASPTLRDQYLGEVLATWSRSDWDGALNWAQQLPDGSDKQLALIHLSYHWSQIDPEGALTYAAGLSTCSGQLLSTLASQWAAADPEAAASWIVNLPPGTLRDSILPGVISIWAEHSPADAAAFLLTLPPGNDIDQALVSVVSSWSRTDPQATVAWMENLPPSPGRHLATEQLAALWALRDPRATENWIEEQELGDARDAAIASYSKVLATSSPGRAFLLAEQIQEQAVRFRELYALGKLWLQTSPADAISGIAQSDLPHAQKKQLLATTQ